MGNGRSLFVIAALFSITACDTPHDLPTQQEVDELHLELRELRDLKHRVGDLEREMAELRGTRVQKGETVATQPITPSLFTAGDSFKDDPFLGPKDAPLLVMAFSEYECAPCRQFTTETLPKLRVEFVDTGKVKFVFRDFPLASHTHAVDAAILAHCAGEQGSYWRAHELLFQHTANVESGDFSMVTEKIDTVNRDRLRSCTDGKTYEREIRADIEDGQKLGAQGAPSFFVGRRFGEDVYRGVFIRGAQPYAVFKGQIEKLLASPSESG